MTKNEPAAYKHSVGATNSTMTAAIRLAATMDLTSSATIMFRSEGIEQFAPEDPGVDVTTWPSDPIEKISTPLPEFNGVYDPLDLSWEYIVKRLDGTSPSWENSVQMNNTTHRIYCTFDIPRQQLDSSF